MLCCTGPLVAASVGLSGAGLAVLLPYRPLFVLLSVGGLWVAWDRLERAGAGSEGDCAIEDLRRRRRLLMIVTILSALLLASPLWDDLVF